MLNLVQILETKQENCNERAEERTNDTFENQADLRFSLCVVCVTRPFILERFFFSGTFPATYYCIRVNEEMTEHIIVG